MAVLPACFVQIRNWGHVLCLRYPDSTKDVWAKCNDRDDGYPSPWLIHPPTTLIFQPVFETTVCQVPCQGYDCSNWWWQVPWKFLGLHLVLLLSMLSGASEVPSFVSFDKHPRFASWWQLNYFLCSPRFVGKLSNLTSFFSNGLRPPTSLTFWHHTILLMSNYIILLVYSMYLDVYILVILCCKMNNHTLYNVMS